MPWLILVLMVPLLILVFAYKAAKENAPFRATLETISPQTRQNLQRYHSDGYAEELYKSREAAARGDVRSAREHANWADANLQNYRNYGGR
jgi:hypothetical protein